MPEPIGETSESQKIYAFEITKDGDPYAIWIEEDGKIQPFHMTKMPNDDIAIEYHDEYGEYVYYKYFGDETLLNFHPEYSKNAIRMDSEKAEKWLKELKEKAYLTEEQILWDSVTGAPCRSDDLSEYVFWSEGIGWWAGPGYEDGHLESAIACPEKDLWPLFNLAGEDTIKQLKEVLSSGKTRRINASNVMVLSMDEEIYEFGWYLGKSLSFDEEYEYRDAILWLDSLSGESKPELKQAELETIAQIELWQKCREGLEK